MEITDYGQWIVTTSLPIGSTKYIKKEYPYESKDKLTYSFVKKNLIVHFEVWDSGKVVDEIIIKWHSNRENHDVFLTAFRDWDQEIPFDDKHPLEFLLDAYVY